MSEYLLPDVGEGLVEAEIIAWRVAVGDVVAVNDVIVEIETAKSLVELPSPFAGEVTALLVNEGDTVAVGTPIIRINDPNALDLSNPAATGGGEGEHLVGRVKDMPSRRRRRSTAEISGEPSQEPGVLASPAVRGHAREAGIDLAHVEATGAFGNVTHDDLRPRIEGRREPVKGIRKAMAQAMVASAYTAPHVTIWVTVDVTATRELQRPLTPLVVLARACIEAIGRTPIINSVWDNGDVVYRDAINLGIAAATPRGLIVPNIKHVQSLTTPELIDAVQHLVQTARDGRTPPEDNAGGSFTITNVGPFGIDGGTPIINPGESAILCFGAIKRQPWVVDIDGEERLAIRDACTLGLSFDHRHIDGETGSRFLADVAASMTDPSRLSL